MEENAQTIRPNKSPGAKKNSLPCTTSLSGEINAIVEDYSDLVSTEEDAGLLESKVADFKVNALLL